LSGLLLLVMGAAMVWIGFTERATPALSGWQATFAVNLQHLGRVITGTFSWLPNWLAILALVLIIAFLTRRAFRQMKATKADEEHPVDSPHNVPEEPGKETTHANT
jgi:type II secretory pathway component PulF